MDFSQSEATKYNDHFPSINDKFLDLMDAIEDEADGSPDPDIFLKIGKEIQRAGDTYIKDCKSKAQKISVCENLCIGIRASIEMSLNARMTTKAISGSVNELEDEPITINGIPSIYQERPFTTTHVERVLSVLSDKYQIKISLEGKLLDEVISLDLEEIGISSMDVKLFIPSMFLNKVNSYRNPDEATFLYQEDYNFIEAISNKGTLKHLAQLYATLDDRKKLKDKTD